MPEIIADLDAPCPPLGLEHLAAWEAFCERVTDAEFADWRAHQWFELCCECRAHAPLTIPPDIADDPRLTSHARFVLAALRDVSRDIDMSAPEVHEAVLVRVWGAHRDIIDRAAYDAGLAELIEHGLVSRTSRGGLYGRAA